MRRAVLPVLALGLSACWTPVTRKDAAPIAQPFFPAEPQEQEPQPSAANGTTEDAMPLHTEDATTEPADAINAPPEELTPAAGAPAMRYAALDANACETELGRRHISFKRVNEPTRGVLAPVRLEGPLSGVAFHSMLPPKKRETSPYEIYDCRLVLALDDYAKILARYDVTEVIHFSVYRPPSPKLAGLGKRHSGALAIDAAIFKTKDGKTLSVEKDFHGRIGGKPCFKGATALPGETGTMRHLVCDAAEAQLFNVMLTPDYNWQHRNHFHLEVTAGVKWMFVR
jgi:hypothetical protein